MDENEKQKLLEETRKFNLIKKKVDNDIDLSLEEHEFYINFIKSNLKKLIVLHNVNLSKEDKKDIYINDSVRRAMMQAFETFNADFMNIISEENLSFNDAVEILYTVPLDNISGLRR